MADNPADPAGRTMEDIGPSMDEINAVLLPVSQQHGYCLCIHPFMDMINFSGTTCVWCGQPVTDAAWTPGAKDIRTAACHAAWPPGHPYRLPATRAGEATAGTPPEP